MTRGYDGSPDEPAAPVQRAFDGSRYESAAGYCRAVRAGGLIWVSGTVAADLTVPDVHRQTTQALRAAIAAAERVAGEPVEVVRTRLYLAPDADWEGAASAHREVLGDRPPANTTLYAHRLIPPGALVEVEVDAIAPGTS